MRALAIGALLIAAAVQGCTRLETSHGYVPTDTDLAAIEVGRDTRATVAVIIGRPLTDALRTENAWYYIGSDFETFLYRAPEETQRQIVAISYSDEGTVANVERFGLEQGRIIPLSRRVTDQNISGISFLRQLFGNFGNIRIQDVLGGE